MRKTIRGATLRPSVSIMILPMIDVVFLLLLFFVMVTSFETTAKIRVDVPRPEDSQARFEESTSQVVINCELAKPAATAPPQALYRVGADPPENLSAISRRLALLKAANPGLTVVVRADRRLPFAQVRDLIEVMAENGVEAVRLSALRKVER